MNFNGEDQSDKAKLEDMLIEILYRKYEDLVFHGGTAIWRCYGGNRFSRDLDFYYKLKTDETTSTFYKGLLSFLKDTGFKIKSSNYNNITDTISVIVEINSIKGKMKADINFRYKPGKPTNYLNIDDSQKVVLSLSPEELINEKMDAYEDKMNNKSEKKQQESQDLYDIYYLTTIIDGPTVETAERLSKLIKKIEADPPKNMKDLKHLILSGISPDFSFLIKNITKWANEKY